MAAWNKFNVYVLDKLSKKHDFRAAGDTFKAMLTNTAPIAANAVKADLTEITAANGYVAGGFDIQNDVSQTAGLATIVATDIVITASGGSFGPFRYVAIYNDTTAGKPLVGWYDYGSSITPAAPDTFTIDFPAGWLTDQ